MFCTFTKLDPPPVMQSMTSYIYLELRTCIGQIYKTMSLILS